MNQQPMQSPRPTVAKWLWILLIIVAVLGAAFFAWYYLMGPGKKTETKTTTPTPVSTAGWKTYTSETYGFSFKHPADWTSAKDLSKFKSAVVGFVSPETTKKMATSKNLFSDIVVAHYNKVSDMTGSPVTLTEALKNTEHYTSYEAGTIASQPGYNVIVNDDPDYYAAFVEQNSHIYEIEFPNAAQKSSLTEVEKAILASFKFFTPAPTEITCTNDTYGFSYTLPITWKACKAKEADFEGSVKTYYVEVATTDSNFAAGDTTADAGYYSPFAITVYTPAQWAAVEAEGGPIGKKITENSDYVFTWSQANGVPASDFTEAMQNQIQDIIDSFKLK